MRKKVFGKQLGRNRKSRTILFKAQARALISHGKIRTTRAKAQALRPFISSLIRLAKKDTLISRRAALAKLGNDKKTVDQLFKTRSSSVIKINLLPPRKGDNAQMAELSLT